MVTIEPHKQGRLTKSERELQNETGDLVTIAELKKRSGIRDVVPKRYHVYGSGFGIPTQTTIYSSKQAYVLSLEGFPVYEQPFFGKRVAKAQSKVSSRFRSKNTTKPVKVDQHTRRTKGDKNTIVRNHSRNRPQRSRS